MEEKEDVLHKNTMGRWERKIARMEDEYNAGVTNLKRYLKAAIKETESRQNVARDLIRARKGDPSKFQDGQYGFGIIKDDEVVTGMEQAPWDRDD